MSEFISAEALASLIGLIYDAVIEPKAWPKALEAIRIELNCANSALSIHSLPSGEVLMNEATNISDAYRARMSDYGPEVLDQWGGMPALMTLPLDRPSVLSEVNPQAVDYETTRNRYSLEWARPQGLVDVLAIPLARDGRALGSAAFGRHESAGQFTPREIAIARLLVPHLQRAATITRLMDQALLARSTFAAAIDALGAPILLVTSALTLVHANPAAERMLEAADLVCRRAGVISSPAEGVSKALAVAVKQAALDESGIDRKGLGFR